MDVKRSLKSLERVEEKFPKKYKEHIKYLKGRLSIAGDYEAELASLCQYISYFSRLPFSETPKIPPFRSVRKALDKNHLGLKEVKELILENISVLKLREGKGKFPIFLLTSSPGCGKTTIARSIADALKRPFCSISLAGVVSPSAIKGSPMVHVGAQPGSLIKCFLNTKSSSPVILLDEIDKIGSEEVLFSLLEVLDSGQNQSFKDNYLDIDYDISNAIFIATANDVSLLHPALLSRMEIIEISSYTTKEKIAICREQIIPKLVKSSGLLINQLAFDNSTLQFIIKSYTSEGGVRKLQSALSKIARKIAKQVVEKKRDGRRRMIGKKEVLRLLGPEKFLPEQNLHNVPPGTVTGLAYTEEGGVVLMLESLKYRSEKPVFTVTGLPGNMTKESSSIVFSYIKAYSQKLKIDLPEIEKSSIHLSYPECSGTGVDGPSAGITTLVALVSLFKGKSVSSKIAMTGELDLRGNVRSIGGLREKLIAAHSKGKKKIIIPEGNEAELVSLPTEILKDLEIIPVSRVEQVLEICKLT